MSVDRKKEGEESKAQELIRRIDRERRRAEIFLVAGNNHRRASFPCRMVLKRVLEIGESGIQRQVYFFGSDIGHRTQGRELLQLFHHEILWIITHQDITCGGIRKGGYHQFYFFSVCPAYNACSCVIKGLSHLRSQSRHWCQ